MDAGVVSSHVKAGGFQRFQRHIQRRLEAREINPDYCQNRHFCHLKVVRLKKKEKYDKWLQIIESEQVSQLTSHRLSF